jgi:Uncharacterized protein conserved in bacteria
MRMPDSQRRRETLFVIYDAECALCTRAVRQLAAVRGARAELRFVPLRALETPEKPETRQTREAEATGGREQEPGPPVLARLDPDALRAQMHVVQADGAVYAGAEAVMRIMRELPGWRLLSPLYRVPGMKRAADAAYRYVAGRRYEWFGKADEGCANGACALHGRADGAGMSRPRPSSTREREER